MPSLDSAGKEEGLIRVMLFPLLCAGLMLQGCLLLAVGAGAGAGAGTLAYVRGELQTTYAASLNRTWDAALGAWVGMLGEEEASKAIDRRIGEQLGTRAGLGGSAWSLRLATRPECPPADDVPTETGIA